MIVIKKKYAFWVISLILVSIIIIGLLPKHYEFAPEHAISDFPTLQQPDNITCGPTSTAMVLQYYGHKVTVEDIKKLTKTHWYGHADGEMGMTAPDYITKVLNQYGLKASLRNNEFNKVKFEISQNRPVIVLVRSGKKTWHYMVAIGYNEKEITFSDPAGGYYRTLKNETFLLAWSHDGNCEGDDYRVNSIFGKTSDYMKILFQATEVRPNTYIITSAL